MLLLAGSAVCDEVQLGDLKEQSINVCYNNQHKSIQCSRNEKLLVLKILQRATVDADCKDSSTEYSCCRSKLGDKLYDIGGCSLNQTDAGAKRTYQAAITEVLEECSQKRYCILESDLESSIHALKDLTVGDEGARPSHLMVIYKCIKGSAVCDEVQLGDLKEESINVCYNNQRKSIQCSRNEKLLVLKILQRATVDADCKDSSTEYSCCRAKLGDKLYDIGGCSLNQTDAGAKRTYQAAITEVLEECSQKRYCILESDLESSIHALKDLTVGDEGARPSHLMVIYKCIKGIANLDGKSAGKMGVVTLAYYISTTVVALVVGLTLVLAIRPGRGNMMQSTTQEAGAAPHLSPRDAFLDLLRNVVQENIVETIQQKQGQSILAYCVVFGLCLGRLGKAGEEMLRIFTSLNDITMTMVTLVIWYSLIGILFLTMSNILAVEDLLTTGRQLGMYMVTNLVGYSVHSAIVLPLIYLALTRRNPYRITRGILQALVTAVGTNSSLCTTLTSVGSAGIPAGGSVTLFVIMSAVGLPPDDVYFVLPVVWLLGRVITMVNISGDCVAAALLAHYFPRQVAGAVHREQEENMIDHADIV